MNTKSKHTFKVGLYGIGMKASWPQFPELEKSLDQNIAKVDERLSGYGSDLVNLGLVDSPEKALDNHKIRSQKKWVLLITFLLSGLSTVSLYAQYYIESGGLLVVELESKSPTPGFVIGDSVPGFKGSGYYTSNYEVPSSGGIFKASYPLAIRTTGSYQIAIRSRFETNTNNAQASAVFVRLIQEDGTPMDSIPNQNVSSNDLWFKVYNSIPGAWTHESANNPEAPRSLAWQLVGGEKYALEISSSSKHLLLDRIVLWNRSQHSLADTITGQSPVEVSLNQLPASSSGSGWIYQGDLTNPDDIFPLLDLVYTWQSQNKIPEGDQEIIGWKHAAFYTGVTALHEATGDPKYIDYLTGIAEQYSWQLIETTRMGWRHADNHLMGDTYIYLHLVDGQRDPSQISKVIDRFDRMLAEPWAGRDLYSWCDALYMSPPVWAKLAYVTGDNRYLEEMDTLWWDSTDFLYNKDWDLFYRDKSYFNSIEANGKPTFWGRGNGWVLGALARVLDYIPLEYPGRNDYIDLFKEMSERIASLQMQSGGWSSGLLYPQQFNFETEMSATAFFVFSLAWGVNQGLLSSETYGPVIELGWMEMNNYVTEEGGIQHIQIVGKEPGPVDDNLIGREYGYGAFILAGLQMAHYYAAREQNSWRGYPVYEINGNQWADTGDFMGWLEISHFPFTYSSQIGGWIVIMESPSTDISGMWIYRIK